MTDVHTKKQRSQNMAAIKNRGNKSTENKLRLLFRGYKINGWRRHYKSLPGTPDFIFMRNKVAIFVDGCFWHGCMKCRFSPQTNKQFWRNKIKENIHRDRKQVQQIKKRGWIVIRIWEHQIKKNPVVAIKKILTLLKQKS
ncbi:very short patch repair endonuclease [Candidatus Woesearchaeota archaeon]|nr:very short patch repair endonuclease [Candidatus Woesearchaeota archaeon]